MTLQSRYPTTADEFLRWNEGREGKREFVRGRVVEMMINVTKRHAVLSTRLASILLRQLPYPEFAVGSADFAVQTPDGIRYPDVFVDRATPASRDEDLVAASPVLLAEVLSSSSYARDLVEKLADYQALDTLRFYLVLSQDEPRVWMWARHADGSWTRMIEIAGTDGMIGLEMLGATVSLAELYAGMAR